MRLKEFYEVFECRHIWITGVLSKHLDDSEYYCGLCGMRIDEKSLKKLKQKKEQEELMKEMRRYAKYIRPI